MSDVPLLSRCEQIELVSLYVLDALADHERQSIEEHIYSCQDCEQELVNLRPVVQSLVAWPTDLLRPSPSLRPRLAWRIASENGTLPALVAPTVPWAEPEWEEVAPGISCKLLANDEERNYVSMLARLAPGTDYPAHAHADVEELHLLDGELWIDGRKLAAGDYLRSAPGTSDHRVRSETGCTCLLMTSSRDVLP